jgi:phosphate transport system substrate-binding protein
MLTRFIAVAAATLINTAAFAVEVTGAGATFPYPIYMKWAEGYKKATNNVINYQGIGSGAGIKQIESKTVNFGATDIPVKPEDLEKKGQVQFPMVVGGIVPIINLKDVDHLTLNVDILAKIYMEKIRRWNDKEIADLNPGVKLPDLPIVKVRRSDGSGTTWNFTRFLAEANADWKKEYGFGQSVEWVGGAIGAKGNDGVANNVFQTNGSIGYVEYAFAKQNNLTVADMIGTDGKKASPSLKSFQTTWPMVATTYIIFNKENENKEATQAAIKFFEYGYANDKDAEALDYVPLTAAQKAESKKAWSQVK